MEGLRAYLSALNIRHKCRHPLFLVLRFNACVRLLYDGVVENYQPPADGDAAAEERRRHAYAMMLALGVGWRAVAFACLRRRTRQSA